MTESIVQGAVDWTGDNPFIYLSTNRGESWSSLALMFRIALARQGSGNAVLVVERPEVSSGRDDALAFCASDNDELARYLVEQFVPHFGVFRGARALEVLEHVEGNEFHCGFATSDEYIAGFVSSPYGEISLRWSGFRQPFAVHAPPPETATGRHSMMSVFRPADVASVEVGGRRLEGDPVERDFFGGRSRSAGLAFSESWIGVA